MSKKKVKVELIEEFEGRGKDRIQAEPYVILSQLREAHHSHLSEAKIALVWRLDVAADRDGKLILGQAKKASDLNREFSDFDLVILLNRDAWGDLTAAQRAAVLDHELMHCAVVKKDGEPARDERGRLCYRLRKHDIEEFRDVITRHGLYLSDVVEFAMVCADAKKTPLFPGTVEFSAKVGT